MYASHIFRFMTKIFNDLTFMPLIVSMVVYKKVQMEVFKILIFIRLRVTWCLSIQLYYSSSKRIHNKQTGQIIP